ncbi:MAG: hypothetical protein KC635_25385, partial [Myxococcales bacterium]|nr:hypothetical protein [Myxococcales bacterium]
EICDDEIDNDCNGKTDAADLACGASCTSHGDCYPDRVCATWVTTGENACSDPCIGTADCPPGQICSKLPGSAQVGFCQPSPAGGLANGVACSVDAQCQSLLCADDVCRPTCLSEDRCPGADTCHPVGDLGLGLVSAACAPNTPGSVAINGVCSDPSGFEYDGSYCASGHCDLMPYPREPLFCSKLCHSETDCNVGQECNIVLYAAATNPSTLPASALHPIYGRDALAACYTPTTPGGTLEAGAPCNPVNHAQCKSNKCLAIGAEGDPQTYCTRYCEFDQECPSGMGCFTSLVTLASDWLQNPNVNPPNVTPYPATTTLYSLIRVCQWQ